jgi:hypothetical protein
MTEEVKKLTDVEMIAKILEPVAFRDASKRLEVAQGLTSMMKHLALDVGREGQTYVKLEPQIIRADSGDIGIDGHVARKEKKPTGQ